MTHEDATQSQIMAANIDILRGSCHVEPPKHSYKLYEYGGHSIENIMLLWLTAPERTDILHQTDIQATPKPQDVVYLNVYEGATLTGSVLEY